MTFNPMNFITSLKYMLGGMLSIFIVIGLIVLVTMFLNKVTKDKESSEKQ